MTKGELIDHLEELIRTKSYIIDFQEDYTFEGFTT